MSQEVQVDDLFWEVAAAFADQKKVFITSGPQSRCVDVLRGGAIELVCIGDTAPVEGVKARSDYRERRISKDLIVDVSGEAPLEVLGKLLKKQGTLVSAVRRDWADQFPLTYGVAWSPTEDREEGREESEVTEELDYVEEDHPNALFWVAATHNIPSLPEIQRVTPVADDTQQRLDEAYAVIGDLQKQVKRAERAKTSAQTHRLKAKTKLEELTVEHLDVTAKLDTLTKEARALKRKVKRVEAKLETHQELQAEHQTLRADYEGVSTRLEASEQERSALGAREQQLITDLDKTRSTLATQREEATTLERALTESKRQLAINVDTSEQLAESQAAAEIARASYEVVADAWRSWLGEGLSEVPARPPISSVALSEQWAQQLLSLRPMVTATLDEYRQISELQAAQHQAQGEVIRLKRERDAARAEVDDLRARSGASDETSRASLEAERALRRAQERELEERNAQLTQYQDEVAQLRAELDEMSGQSHSTSSDSSPRVLQLEAQVRAQGEQRKARERLMQVNYQLQLELTARLEEEIEARALLSHRLDEAERELRSLRADQEFPRPAASPSSKARHDQRRKSRQESRQESRSTSSRGDRDRPRKSSGTQSVARAAARPAARPATERLSSLTDQLKRSANQRSEAVRAAQDQESQDYAPALHKSSKRDQKRIRKQAKRLKAKHQVSTERTPPVTAASTAPKLPEMSSEERVEQAERARMILQDRLKKLGRRRRS